MSIFSSFKNYLRRRLPWSFYKCLKRTREEVRAFLSAGDLTSLAIIYQTDKWGRHAYTPVYAQWLQPLRYEKIRLLEIGIGGYAKPRQGGNSLRMWKHFFPDGIITGIDIYQKKDLCEKRIHIHTGDQTDAAFLHELNTAEGPFNIIVDDGSHMQSHIIKSFEILFPLLKENGLYIIEDTQTSYWPKFEGSTSEMNTIPSAMNYFIQKIHQVNQLEWIKEDLHHELKDDMIDAISFYHNLIIIRKKG